MPDNSSKFNPNLCLDIPKWINEKYFENILKKDVTNFRRILNFSIIPATPPGENYTSIMLRIKMDIEMDGKLIKIIFNRNYKKFPRLFRALNLNQHFVFIFLLF